MTETSSTNMRHSRSTQLTRVQRQFASSSQLPLLHPQQQQQQQEQAIQQSQHQNTSLAPSTATTSQQTPRPALIATHDEQQQHLRTSVLAPQQQQQQQLQYRSEDEEDDEIMTTPLHYSATSSSSSSPPSSSSVSTTTTTTSSRTTSTVIPSDDTTRSTSTSSSQPTILDVHYQQQQHEQQHEHQQATTGDNVEVPYQSRGIPDDYHHYQKRRVQKEPLIVETRTFVPSDSNKIKGIYGHCMCIRHETNMLYVYGGWVQNSARTDALLSLDLSQLDTVSNENRDENRDDENCENHHLDTGENVSSKKSEKEELKVEWQVVEQRGLVKPGPCSFASLIELNGCLILFGGYFHNSWVNDMWSFDLETQHWTKIEYRGREIIPPRAAHSCNLTRNKTRMIVHAGFDGTKVLNDLWSFSFLEQEWTELKNHNSVCHIEPTTCHSCVMSYDEERLVKFGGWDRTQYFSYLYEYDLNRCEWNQVKLKNMDCVPPQRWSHVSVMVKSMMDLEDRLVVMLGSAQSYFSDCHIFDFGSKMWSEAKFQPPLEAQNSMTSVLTWDSRILLFGGRRKTEYINSLTELTIKNVAPLSMFHWTTISRSTFKELMTKKFACDIDIICQL